MKDLHKLLARTNDQVKKRGLDHTALNLPENLLLMYLYSIKTGKKKPIFNSLNLKFGHYNTISYHKKRIIDTS